jgi:hypothetical protein
VRAALAQGPQARAGAPVSSWRVMQVSVDGLRDAVRGQWSQVRLHACLARLERYLRGSPRRRVHQESTAQVWLAQRLTARPISLPRAA